MRSLRSRLFVPWALALAACVIVGLLLVQFYRESASAQVQRAEAVIARSCDMIRNSYGFYATGWSGPPGGDVDAQIRRGLRAVVLVALAHEDGVVASWSRHVARMEAALARRVDGTLPALPPTGEKELDRIIAALNDAGRRLADARRRSDELTAWVTASERLASLGRVAAGVAHEIRNPIAAMRLKAENALAGDPTRMRAALGVVLTQIARLDDLVSQLLAMTQRREAILQAVDVVSFLHMTAEEYRDLAAARGVTIHVDSQALTGRFDPALARRAMGNLVLNAIQHTPAHGTVMLSAALAESWLRVVVADSGAGVAPALRETLFEPFVSGRPEGTGLGLALACEFAEAQGGRVRLLSPGGAGDAGAVFALELPWQPS